MNCKELCNPTISGHIKIFEKENPENVIFNEKNLILNGTSWLFSQLMYNNLGVQHGVWGLAVGGGDPAWDGAGSLVEPIVTDWNLIAPFPVPGPGRIALSTSHFIDSTGLAVPWSTTVDFQTNISTTIFPDLKGEAIRELGLIGGVQPSGSDFSHAPFFNSTAPSTDSVILINLKRFQELTLPDGVNFIISWQLAF